MRSIFRRRNPSFPGTGGHVKKKSGNPSSGDKAEPKGYDGNGDPVSDEDVGEEAGDPNRSVQVEYRSRNAFLAEDDTIDSDDPNLSALFAETGVEERLDELGL
jgi:hypothetical protein